MHKLCRINIEDRQAIAERLRAFVRDLSSAFRIKQVYLYGSFARGEIHEGSDIDIVVIGDFKERFIERIGLVLDLTDLPIEPLVYTEAEFQQMLESQNPFIKEIAEKGLKLMSDEFK